MIDALYVAATGMQAEQSHIDTISNNLANLNTTGFKRSQVRFDDLVYRHMVAPTGEAGSLPSAGKVGLGAHVAEITKIFDAGDLKATGNQLDIAIGGKGFFEVELENGELAYTRNGSFRVNQDGFLEISGHLLANRIQLPPDVSEIQIGRDGLVQVKIGGDEETYEVGQVELSYFLNDGGLEAMGSGMYVATEQSGRAYYSQADLNGLGKLEQGFLEASNVDLVQELVELTVAQRGFEVNSQLIRASDQIMQIINNLRQ